MIDETLAIEIAKKHAQKKGWGFDEPFQVVARKRWYGLFGSIKQYEIEAHSGRPNIKTRIVVDTKKGKILYEGPQISLALAIEIAKRSGEEKGWGFAEPLDVRNLLDRFGGVERYEIFTGAGSLGTKARFFVDGSSGEIISEGYIPPGLLSNNWSRLDGPKQCQNVIEIQRIFIDCARNTFLACIS